MTNLKLNFYKNTNYYSLKNAYKIAEYHDSFEDELYNRLEFFRQNTIIYNIFKNSNLSIISNKFKRENILYILTENFDDILNVFDEYGFDFLEQKITKKYNISYRQIIIYNSDILSSI